MSTINPPLRVGDGDADRSADARVHSDFGGLVIAVRAAGLLER